MVHLPFWLMLLISFCPTVFESKCITLLQKLSLYRVYRSFSPVLIHICSWHVTEKKCTKENFCFFGLGIFSRYLGRYSLRVLREILLCGLWVLWKIVSLEVCTQRNKYRFWTFVFLQMKKYTGLFWRRTYKWSIA